MIRALVLFVAVLFIALNVIAAQPPPGYGFGFISRDENGAYVLNVLDAATLRLISRPLAFTADESLMTAHPSPDGQQLALWFNSYRDSQVRDPNTGHITYFDTRLSNFVRVFDLISGSTRDVMHQEFMFDDFNRYQKYDLVPAWSPDGRYLLFDSSLYDLETGLMQDLGFDTFISARAWSPDSQHLAVAMIPPRLCCSIALVVFALPDMTVLHQTTISETDVCKLRWSPDQRALIFEHYCDLPNNRVDHPYTEIYYWDLAAGTLRQLTDLAAMPGGGRYASGQVAYNTVWLDAENLLLSTYHFEMSRETGQPALSIVDASFDVGTFLLRPPAIGARRLNDAWSREFALEPNTGLLAYESMVMDPATADVLDHRVEIARFVGDALLVQATGTAGEDFHWSPDGEWLAYSSQERRGTRVFWSLHFLNAQTGQQREYLPPQGEISIVGWQHAPEFRRLSFPQGTPTPVPTQIPLAG